MKKRNCTFFVKKKSAQQERTWFVFDAENQTLGRFASEMTKVLRGKHRPDFTPSIDNGDGVIILNAEKIAVTGAKAAQKVYRHYTGSMGGLRTIPFEVVLKRTPKRILQQAIKGMMPKSRLTSAQLKRLRIFAGSEHNMSAQNPVVVDLR